MNLGEEVTQGYAAHPWPPDLTVATSSLVRQHFLVYVIKPMVSASVDATRTGYTGRPARQAITPLRLNGWVYSYRRHARLRMVGRGVSEDDVRQCLNEHGQRVQTAKQNQYKGYVGGRMLKVWVAPDRDPDVERFIVSVAWEDDDDDS